ncbi:MAG: phosphate ABC transporter permease subunit PstC, partial [Anaerolineaceae bacterium]
IKTAPPDGRSAGWQPAQAAELQQALKKRSRWGERLIQSFLFLCGALSILITLGIVYELGKESLLFFTRRQWDQANKTLAAEIVSPADDRIELSGGGRTLEAGDWIRVDQEAMQITAVSGSLYTVERAGLDTTAAAHAAGSRVELSSRVTLGEFFGGLEWNPQIGKFGIWPLVNATLLTSLIAMAVAAPAGLAIAIYLSEYATARARQVLKPTLEILAGIPTVVFGYFALTFMTPLLRSLLGKDTVAIYNTASAGIVIGILIIPIISSISEDALHAVPRSLREGAYALGATRLETALKIVVPAAFSGIAAAILLGISRAVGETMVVAIAAGAGPAFTFNPFRPAETMTGHIVRISGGDLSYNTLDYNSIFAIGLLLFAITLILNIVSRRLVAKYREVYE